MTKHNEGLGVVGRGRGSIGLGLGVLSSSLVCDIGDISIIAVGRVLDMLDTSIGKSNRVRAGDVGGTIGLLLSVEVGLGVVISDGVGEGVGGNLIGVGLSLVGGGGGVVSRGSVGNDGGGVDGVSDDGSGVDSVGHDGSGVHGVSHRVGENRGVDGMSHGVDGVVGNGVDSVGGVGNHGGVDSVSDNSRSVVGGEVASGDDGSSVADGGVVSHVRGGGSGGKAEEGRDNKSLKHDVTLDTRSRCQHSRCQGVLKFQAFQVCLYTFIFVLS